MRIRGIRSGSRTAESAERGRHCAHYPYRPITAVFQKVYATATWPDGSSVHVQVDVIGGTKFEGVN